MDTHVNSEDYHELPMIDFNDNETGCCPRFHPESWDDKRFRFSNLKFIKATTKSFLYMPLNMSKVMTTTMAAVDAAHANPTERYLILSKDVSKWQCDHYFLVSSNVPDFATYSLDGTYYAKVYDGQFKDMPKWMKDFELQVAEHGTSANEVMSFYTTCPKCAKHYGHNYVVIFGKLNE